MAKRFPPWNKGLTKETNPRIKGGCPKGTRPWNKNRVGIYSSHTIKKISDAAKKQWSEGNGVGGFKKGMIPWNLGKTYSSPKMRGENNPMWRGGITDFLSKLKHSREYENWRKQTFERDNYTCQLCFTRGGRLNADHILPKSLYPEKVFDTENGRTLCIRCHLSTDTFGGRVHRQIVK